MDFSWLDTSQGLEADGWTWILAVILTLVWLGSFRVMRRPRGTGWSAVPMSLFGWMWLSFGVNYAARFWILSLDSVNYGNFSTRLTLIPAGVVNASLLLAILFWVAVCVAYLILSGLRNVTGGERFSGWSQEPVGRWTDALCMIALSALMIRVLWNPMPASLLRLIGLVISFWIVPATIAWASCAFPEARTQTPRVRRWLYMAPGILSFVIEPYREYLLILLVIPFIAALFQGRRVRLPSVVTAVLVFAVVSTVIVGSLRRISWEGFAAEEAFKDIDVSEWVRDPSRSPLGAVLRRFHSFDSLLLTTHLVPNVFPFEEGNLLARLLVETFVPRAFYPEKPESARAMFFSRTIWSYGNPEAPEANIAPSMVGDLYSNGGAHWVLIGGILWGALIGALERWRLRLRPIDQAVVVCYLALLIAGGLERDFSRAAGTIIQGILVMYAAAFVLTGGKLWRRAAESGPEATAQESESSKWQPSLGPQRGPAQQVFRPPLRERLPPRQLRPGKPFE